MKNRQKVTFAGVLAALMLSLAFGGCGQKSEEPKESAEQEEEEAKEETAEEEEIPEEETLPEPAPAQEQEETVSPEMIFTDVEDTVYIAGDGVNLRMEPSTEAQVLDVAPLGRMMKRTGQNDTWSRLVYEDQTCYVPNDLISTEMPQMDVAKPESPEASETPDVSHMMTANGRTVVIDPGHQLHQDSGQEPVGPGASETKNRVTSGTSGAVSGLQEYELNLQVSLKLRDELEARGYTVYMTRKTHEVNMSNRERAEFATAQGGDILVRIHANGAEDSSVQGALTMAPSEGNSYLTQEVIADSQKLSQYILESYVAETGFQDRGVSITDSMSGINWSTMPVTIVEMGFMSNPSDDASMADEAMQEKMADGIADGIDRYFAQ